MSALASAWSGVAPLPICFLVGTTRWASSPNMLRYTGISRRPESMRMVF